jgi:hypothetical protein
MPTFQPHDKEMPRHNKKGGSPNYDTAKSTHKEPERLMPKEAENHNPETGKRSKHPEHKMGKDAGEVGKSWEDHFGKKK